MTRLEARRKRSAFSNRNVVASIVPRQTISSSLDMAPAAAAPAAPSDEDRSSHRFYITPLRHTKTLYLIRHGEGYHNLHGEKDHAQYASEKFFDASLTPKGWEQCAALKAHLESAKTPDGRESLLDRIECVVVSPLTRALETAVGALGGDDLDADAAAKAAADGAPPPLMIASDAEEDVRPGHAAVAMNTNTIRAPLPFVACELCREHIGKNPCDRRRDVASYRAAFPGVDFSGVTEEKDVLWGTMCETNDDMARRAHTFLEWVMRRPEQHVAVVTHSAFMSTMLRSFGATDQLGTAPAAVKGETHRWPNNCEMGPVVVVDPSGGGGVEPMFWPGGGAARGVGREEAGGGVMTRPRRAHFIFGAHQSKCIS